MRARLLCVLVLSPVLCVAGCSTDTDTCRHLAECTGHTLETALELFRTIADLLEDGGFDFTTGAYSTSFAGVNVSGTVSGTGAADISDGFQVGELFLVSYVLSGAATGSGPLAIDWRSSNEMYFWDLGGTISTRDSCIFEIHDIGLYIDPAGVLAPTGAIAFTTSSGSDELTGMLNFSGGTKAECSFSCGLIDDCFCYIDLITFEVLKYRCEVPIG